MDGSTASLTETLIELERYAIISGLDKGIHFINDIVKEDGTFYTQHELQVMYNININFLHYYGLIKAVKTWGKRLKIENIGHKLNMPFIPYTLKIYIKHRKGIKDMYINLIRSTIIPRLERLSGIIRIILVTRYGREYIYGHTT